MARVYIEELSHHVGNEVTLKGWLAGKRSSGKIHFLQVRDGTGVCQCVASLADLGAERFAAADHMGQETSLEVTGIVREDKRAPGGFELTMKSIRSCCRPAIIRSPTKSTASRSCSTTAIWDQVVAPARRLAHPQRSGLGLPRFFYERGFVLFDAPILTPTSCEGTTNLFELDYFGERKAYLTQSGQLYAEAGALAFGKVSCFGPTFARRNPKRGVT